MPTPYHNSNFASQKRLAALQGDLADPSKVNVPPPSNAIWFADPGLSPNTLPPMVVLLEPLPLEQPGSESSKTVYWLEYTPAYLKVWDETPVSGEPWPTENPIVDDTGYKREVL